MTITVLGATGRTGSQVVEQALMAGHSVNALIRKPGTLAERPGITVFVGDATRPSDIAKASKGADAIISALGGTKANLMTSAIEAVIEASKASGVRRFVLMSSFAVCKDRLSISARLATHVLLKKMVADKAASERLLRQSNLDWTIVYATRLANKAGNMPARIVAPNEKVGLRDEIAPSAVAAWMVAECHNNNFVKADAVITQ